jgi:hypothetical protein
MHCCRAPEALSVIRNDQSSLRGITLDAFCKHFFFAQVKIRLNVNQSFFRTRRNPQESEKQRRKSSKLFTLIGERRMVKLTITDYKDNRNHAENIALASNNSERVENTRLQHQITPTRSNFVFYYFHNPFH